VAEQVVEQIRLGDVVELVGAAYPPGDREVPPREVLEKHRLGQQALDADQLPAGGGTQVAVELVEARDGVGRHAERVLGIEKRAARATGQQLALALEQRGPNLVISGAVIGPRLFDDASGVLRDHAAVGGDVFNAARLRVHGDAPRRRAVRDGLLRLSVGQRPRNRLALLRITALSAHTSCVYRIHDARSWR